MGMAITMGAGKIIFSHGSNKSRGVAILIHPNIDVEIVEPTLDADGRYIVVQMGIRGNQITLCNLYAPNTDTLEFFRTLFGELDKRDNVKQVLGGDFNLVIKPNMDRL